MDALASAISHRPLPRVLYPVALDGSNKFGSLEEQVFFLAKAFREQDSLLLPVFLESKYKQRVRCRFLRRQDYPPPTSI